MCSSPVDSAIKKPKIDNYSPNFSSSSNNNKSKTSPDSKIESVIVNIDSDSIDSIAVQNEKTEITNMTVDMLDFSCSICKYDLKMKTLLFFLYSKLNFILSI
jgi:hypothetical protein